MKKILFPLLILGAFALYQYSDVKPSASAGESATADQRHEAVDNSALIGAFEARAEDVQIEGSGEVIKILPDDNKGSRHQRFLVRVSPQQTILIAHNIDLAPRVDALREGDTVAFAGEYVWNDKGGVVHWTHRDPRGRHVAGWIRRDGQLFQ